MFGIIKANYSSNDIEPTSLTDLNELENTPTTYISIKEVSRLQSQHNNILNNIKCSARKLIVKTCGVHAEKKTGNVIINVTLIVIDRLDCSKILNIYILFNLFF